MLWKFRRAEKTLQDVSVDLAKASLSIRSHKYMPLRPLRLPVLSFSSYLQVNHQSIPSWSPCSGFYQTQDNQWVQLHCNFPNHEQAVLMALGLTDTGTSESNRISIQKAVLQRFFAPCCGTFITTKHPFVLLQHIFLINTCLFYITICSLLLQSESTTHPNFT